MISGAASVSYQGLQQNLQHFYQAAARISDPDSDAGIEEIAELKMAEHGAKLNAAVLAKTNSLSGHLLDVLA